MLNITFECTYIYVGPGEDQACLVGELGED